MRQTLAWVAPLGVIALVTGGAAYTAAAASSPDLADRTAAEVLALVVETEVDQVSGTVRTDADLGLPELPEGFELPGAGPSADAGTDTDTDSDTGTDSGQSATGDPASQASPAGVLTRLLGGENSLRVWVDGPGDRFRADLDDPIAGASVVRDGDAVSFWGASDPGTVTRFTPPGAGALPDDTAPDDTAPDDTAPDDTATAGIEDLTPLEAAERFVAEADGSTEIRLDDPTVVAGRDAYVLVADPRDDATLVDRMVLAVDADTGLPLRFQVFAVDQRRPAFQTGFTDVEFAAPGDEVFDEAFPEGATVRDAEVGDFGDLLGLEGLDVLPGPDEARDDETERPDRSGDQAHGGVEVVGEGWSAVAVLGEPGEATAGAPDGPDATSTGDDAEVQAVLGGLLEPVDGGQALRTALVSVLVADDGRVLVGSVPVERLVEVAAG